MKFAWCEVDSENRAVRIFKNAKEVWNAPSRQNIVNYPYFLAIQQIRDQVWERSRGNCERCGNIITKNFHMNEKIHRGQGGEISVANSEALCADCHIGPEGEHGNRRPQFTKVTERVK